MQQLLESLLDDLAVEETTKKNLLVLDGIRVVDGAVTGDKSIQLAAHEEQHVELVGILLLGNVLAAEVNQHNLAEELCADLVVGHGVGDAEDDAELLAEVRASLGLAVKAVFLVGAEEEFDAIGQEGVGDALGLGWADETLEDFPIVCLNEGLHDHHDGDEVLVLSPREAEGDVAVAEVVEDVGLGGLVGAYGSHYDTVRGVGGASVLETRTDDGEREVSAVHEEHADELFDTVDNEVAAQLFGLFSSCDELGRGAVLEVALVGLFEVLISVFNRLCWIPRLLLLPLTLTMMGIWPSSRTNS